MNIFNKYFAGSWFPVLLLCSVAKLFLHWKLLLSVGKGYSLVKPDPQGLRKEHLQINLAEDDFNEVFSYCIELAAVQRQMEMQLKHISSLPGSSLL